MCTKLDLSPPQLCCVHKGLSFPDSCSQGKEPTAINTLPVSPCFLGNWCIFKKKPSTLASAPSGFLFHSAGTEDALKSAFPHRSSAGGVPITTLPMAAWINLFNSEVKIRSSLCPHMKLTHFNSAFSIIPLLF